MKEIHCSDCGKQIKNEPLTWEYSPGHGTDCECFLCSDIDVKIDKDGKEIVDIIQKPLKSFPQIDPDYPQCTSCKVSKEKVGGSKD